MDPPKPDLLDIYLTMTSESVISEIQNLWGSSFSSKCSKFKLDFINEEKTSENFFSFWDNCTLTGIVKFTLLKTGDLSLAANMLENSSKILHVNKRYFFQLNCFASDQ